MRSARFFIGVRALGLALLLALPIQLSARSVQPRSFQLIARAEQITGDRFSVMITSPGGVSVIAATPPRPEVLTAIDRGFADLFAVARRHGYRNHLNFADYTVFIGRADRSRNSSGRYSPDIAVPAGQYAGG